MIRKEIFLLSVLLLLSGCAAKVYQYGVIPNSDQSLKIINGIESLGTPKNSRLNAAVGPYERFTSAAEPFYINVFVRNNSGSTYTIREGDFQIEFKPSDVAVSSVPLSLYTHQEQVKEFTVLTDQIAFRGATLKPGGSESGLMYVDTSELGQFTDGIFSVVITADRLNEKHIFQIVRVEHLPE